MVAGESGMAGSFSTERDVERRITDLARDLAPMQRATDVPDLFAGLAWAVVDALRCDACLVSVLDDERKVLRDVGASVVPPAQLRSVAEERSLAAHPVSRRVIDSGEPAELAVDDAETKPESRDLLREMGFGRLLIVPLEIQGRVLGTIEAYRSTTRSFRADDAIEVGVLASFAAGAFERINLAVQVEAQYTTTIEALAAALEAKDPYTLAHTGRIRDLASALAVVLQLEPDQRRAVRLGAILHDVGKIGIADAILLKPGPLNDAEWTVMRTHPQIGERMLAGIEFLRPALPVVRHHHERWDGRGYPHGLAGDAIPVGARIVAVCDAFDAMTSDRPYRDALSIEHALDNLVAGAGTQFDPACARLFAEIVGEVGTRGLEAKLVRFAG